jgi:hypothetical protein
MVTTAMGDLHAKTCMSSPGRRLPAVFFAKLSRHAFLLADGRLAPLAGAEHDTLATLGMSGPYSMERNGRKPGRKRRQPNFWLRRQRVHEAGAV